MVSAVSGVTNELQAVCDGHADEAGTQARLAALVQRHEAFCADLGLDAAVVLGERMLLTRMLATLADNAVKFSPAGATIDVAVATSGSEFRLSVRDRGPGLPEGFEATAFERFTRAETVAAVPGHGLGLPLVRAVALRHGMKIELQHADPGLRATVCAPLARA